tara:strand:+ start:534 stop:1091 length:558 start_codon:yes stop_codon:yes gene_type:complete
MVAEILAGIALAKSAVTGIKSMIDTANDVNDIAHHIDNLFKSRDQVKRDIHKNQNKKPQSKMRKMFNRKMHEDEDDDLSVGAVATMVLEQKKMDREIMNLGIRIDNKFGEGTWTEILETRKKMIEEHNKQVQAQREMDKQHDIEVHDFWIKVWTWTWQIMVVFVCVIGMWWWLSYASKGKLPFLW